MLRQACARPARAFKLASKMRKPANKKAGPKNTETVNSYTFYPIHAFFIFSVGPT